jgi:hypothetical protein
MGWESGSIPRLISCQSFLNPSVRAVFVAAYLGSEDCGALAVYKEHSQASKRGWSRGFVKRRPNQPITPQNS